MAGVDAAMQHMVSEKVGATLLVLVQDDQAPSNAEWDAFLGLLRANLPNVKILVVTKGGGPDEKQRKRLELTLGRSRFRVAVVSDSVKVRFVAAMIALFHKEHRSFTSAQTQEAYAHLEMTRSESTLADAAIRNMQAKLLR
jgi:hypothetical protein